MKKLLVSVLAIAGLVACNNEQTLVKHNDKVAMEFGAFVENALTTRAAQDPSLKTADLTGFDVWAYMDSYDGLVLSDEDVELVNGAWSYANLQYWLPGHDYYFTAIAPMNGENWDYAQTAETISFTNVEGTEDLLFATATSSTKDESVTAYETVKLTFKHLLSKTKFTFKNGYTTKNMDIVVSNIQMVAPESAKYEINSTEAHKWTNYADEVTLAYGDVERIGAGAKAESTYERLTIPATAAQDYKITYDITVYSGEVVAFEVSKETILSDVALEQGKAYNFVATITPDNIIDGGLQPIVFEVVEVVDWVYVTEDEGQIAEAELRAAVQLGGNVELTNNVVLTAPLNVTKDLVLNLNGFTLTNAVENAATDVIVVAEGATLTVEGEGVIEAVSGNDGYAIISEGTVVINGGEFKAGVDANGAANAVVYARGNGQVYVNGGYFPNENNSTYVLNKKDADRATTVIEVRGGKFENFDPANNAAENAGTNFVADGYFSLRNGNVYEVVELAGNITLADDVVLGAPLRVRKNVVFNLNGKTISINREGVEKQDYVFLVLEGGKLTINGEGNVAAGEANTSVAVWAYGGDVVINGGYYTNAGEGCDLIYADKGSVVEINGGTFEAVKREDGVAGTNEKYSALNCRDNSGSSFVVKGGKYYMFNPANNASEGPDTNFVAAGYKAIAEGDWFVVVAQ